MVQLDHLQTLNGPTSLDRNDMSLLAQSDLLLSMAHLYLPPDKDLRQKTTTFQEEVERLLSWADFSNSEPLKETFRIFFKCALESNRSDLQDEYSRLFLGSTICPINETAYLPRDKGSVLADIAGFYKAFGVNRSAKIYEKDDHLVCELEFIAILFYLLAQARIGQHREQEEITRRALISFSSQHFDDWFPSFCHLLLEKTALDFYRLLTEIMVMVWENLKKKNELPSVSQISVMAPSTEKEDVGDCGVTFKPNHPRDDLSSLLRGL